MWSGDIGKGVVNSVGWVLMSQRKIAQHFCELLHQSQIGQDDRPLYQIEEMCVEKEKARSKAIQLTPFTRCREVATNQSHYKER